MNTPIEIDLKERGGFYPPQGYYNLFESRLHLVIIL